MHMHAHVCICITYAWITYFGTYFGYQSTQIRLNSLKFTQICSNTPKFTQICSNIVKFHENTPKIMKILIILKKVLIFKKVSKKCSGTNLILVINTKIWTNFNQIRPNSIQIRLNLIKNCISQKVPWCPI